MRSRARFTLIPAEWQVAQLVTEGKMNRQITEQLFISRKTVSTNLRRVFDKSASIPVPSSPEPSPDLAIDATVAVAVRPSLPHPGE